MDTNNVSDVEKELFEAVNANPGSKVTIDAAKLEYISSAGLRILMKLRKQIKKPLPVINVSAEVYEIFDVTGFTELLDVKKALREISVEGCELIGQGGYGKVYRIDPETIAKIYRSNLSLDFVEQERNTSQKAFLMGVPTAISYDVVKCGDSYGVVYELLDAKTTAQIVDKDPSRLQEIFSKSAMLLKELHKIVPGEDAGLPNRKENLIEWVDSLAEYLEPEEVQKLKDFINSIPDRDTFLHGDYNSKNVMLRGADEFQLIDVGDAAVGHPIFDIAGLMLAYIILPNSSGGSFSDEERRGLLGFDFELAPKVWGVMCGAYFGLSSPEEIEATTKKLMPYCLLMMAYQSIAISGENKEMIRARVGMIVRERVLPAIGNAVPLDF